MASDLLPDAVVRYADHADGILDVHLPREPNGRTVLLVHGGFWKTVYDRTHTRPQARALADAGFLVATPEYRRVGPGGSGGWPRTGGDVALVVQRLPELLTGIGQQAGPLSAIGHSAGGHLVLWLASTGTPLDRVVALAPVCDLDEAIRLRLGSDAARAFLGEIDAEQADPMRLLAGHEDADIVVVHGIEDETVPVTLARGLVARYPWIRLREVPCGHDELIDPGSAVWPIVLDALSR